MENNTAMSLLHCPYLTNMLWKIMIFDLTEPKNSGIDTLS